VERSSQLVTETAADTSRPALSACLVTRGSYEPLRKTIGFLKRQSVLDQLELVIAAPSCEALQLDKEDVAPFQWLRVVEVGDVNSSGPAFAAAVHAARARWVVYSEEHSFPDERWAEALIEAQRRPYAVAAAGYDRLARCRQVHPAARACAPPAMIPGCYGFWGTLRASSLYSRRLSAPESSRFLSGPPSTFPVSLSCSVRGSVSASSA
jgi:hypothetical protein